MATKYDRNKGVWIVIAGSDIIPMPSEIRALRAAVASNGSAQFVEWGTPVGDGLPPQQVKPTPSGSEDDGSGF